MWDFKQTHQCVGRHVEIRGRAQLPVERKYVMAWAVYFCADLPEMAITVTASNKIIISVFVWQTFLHIRGIIIIDREKY